MFRDISFKQLDTIDATALKNISKEFGVDLKELAIALGKKESTANNWKNSARLVPVEIKVILILLNEIKNLEMKTRRLASHTEIAWAFIKETTVKGKFKEWDIAHTNLTKSFNAYNKSDYFDYTLNVTFTRRCQFRTLNIETMDFLRGVKTKSKV